MTSTVLVTGNTYPVKDQIKALGGKWYAASKGWLVPADKADEARKLVADAPQPAPRKSYRGSYDPNKFNGYGARRGGYSRRNEDLECEVCGKNKYKCGHCVGW